MTEKSKIWNQGEKGIYRNDGPINPVVDEKAAHSMALAEEKARQDHAEAVKKLGEVSAGKYPSDLIRVERIAQTDVETYADKVSEGVRSNIGGQNLDRGKELFNLVELQPPAVSEQSVAPESQQPPQA